MKKLIFFIFLLIISSGNLFSQSGWFWQNPLPQGNDLNHTKFLNDTTGWAVGKKGVIIKTTDGGNFWWVQNTNSVSDLTSLWILDNLKIISIGTNGGIFRTTNSGVNWIYSKLPGLNFNLSSIYFINNIGWIAGYDHVTTNGYIYKTTNDGENWILNFTSPLNHRFFSIQFLNNLTGYATTSGYLYKTTNSGNNWIQFGIFPAYKSHFIDEYSGVCIMNYLQGSVYNGYIYKTTNSGLNSSIMMNTVDTLLYDLYSLNNQIMFSSGQKGKILKTTNYGDNWLTTSTFLPHDLNSVYFHNSDSGISVGSSGTIIRTLNTGNNWLLRTLGIPYRNFTSCFFLNQNTGLICGSNSILKTTNSGINWLIKWDSANIDWNSLFMLNGNTGWLLGNNHLIYKTTNSGENWFYCSDINNYPLDRTNSIYFINETIGFMAGFMSWGPPSYQIDALVFKSTNGGFNWSGSIHSSCDKYNDVKFINSNTGFIVGDQATIIKTTNAGNNWVTILSQYPANFSFTKLQFVNDNTGWVIGTYQNSNSEVYKTTNSGVNWQIQFSFINEILTSLHCFDINNIWVTSQKGKVYASSNSGITWYYQETPNTNALRSTFFVSFNTGWAVGDNGIIIKTISGVIPNKIDPISTQIPNSFSLHQNYPNPFNPVTKIKFDIPQRHLPLQGGDREGVLLKIYDLLGREISTLVNEQLKPGSYSVDWDASGYASGVYFYSLVTDQYTETKRMVLLK